MTQDRRQIFLINGAKVNIRAFIKWVKDKYRLGRDPYAVGFPVNQAEIFLHYYKTHKQFIRISKIKFEATKTEKIGQDTKWN